ncbi:F-box and leucine-rich repeat protein 4 [Mactra antiquata]
MVPKFFKNFMRNDPTDNSDSINKEKKSGNLFFNAKEVTDFSSQYGGEETLSYTACNLAGRGSVFPMYGDYTQACVFRTYGEWWDIAPSRKKPFSRTPPSFCSQDYIELLFEQKVHPTKIEIFETFNPGCVVKILACQTSEDTNVDTGHKITRWKTLWEGPPDKAEQRSRSFSPSLKPCDFPTNLIRLELCHKLVNYYTELDSVALHGRTPTEEDKKEADGMTQMVKQMDKLEVKSETESNKKKGDVTIRNVPTEPSDDSPQCDNGYFDKLPEEVIQLILGFLDVLSLCRVACTSRLLYKHSYDSLQYTELNLQPHWPQVNSVALDSLHSRSLFLQRLNLSWCHQNIVTETSFCRYINVCGKNLRDLYLSSCSFVTKASIHQISEACPKLKELDIGSCKMIGKNGFEDISKLKHLERLNLYRTDIRQSEILGIIRSCPNLQHLNLGSVHGVHNMDEVMTALSEHTAHLKSLDLWRNHNVTSAGIHALANCTKLEELDIGWCNNVKSQSQCLIAIIKNCLNLKKLFLTANRTVTDTDLLTLAEYSSLMEQLDILGNRLVNADTAEKVLQKCVNLNFFDVSFCAGIDNYTVQQWKQQFPHVAVKKSFQDRQ